MGLLLSSVLKSLSTLCGKKWTVYSEGKHIDFYQRVGSETLGPSVSLLHGNHRKLGQRAKG